MSEHAGATGSGGVPHSFRFRRLLWHLLIGLGVVAIVLLVQDRGFLKTNTDDAAADELMRFHAGVVQENKPVYPFALIAIDEQTYRDWNEPLITPRDKLATIIDFARRGEAKLIFLDIELSRLGDGTPFSLDEPARTCSELRPLKKVDVELCDGMIGQPGKCEQLRQLRNADARLCEVVTQTDSVPIILARTIVARANAPAGGERWEVRPSFLDPILGDVPNASAPKVHWASPLYSLDSDRFIRRSRLWELVCENNKLKAVPSVELLVLTVLSEPDETSKLAERMKKVPRGNCVDRKTDESAFAPLILSYPCRPPSEIHLRPDSPRDRILYSIAWSEQSRMYADQPVSTRRSQVTIPEDKTEKPERKPSTNRKTDLVTTISARTISDSVDASIVKDHIVVIGATHREAGDLHETPLGLMPGSLIIINAIHSLRQYGQLSEPSVWRKGILATLVMTIFVLAYHVFWTELVSFVFPFLSFIVAFCLNILFVYESIWIDAALPTLIYSILNILYLRFIELAARGAVERRKNPHSTWRPWLRALLNEKTFG